MTRDTPGACGCIHSEQNAVVKADGHMREKVAFVTASPCVMCAKLLIQANVTHVFYREPYRKPDGIEHPGSGRCEDHPLRPMEGRLALAGPRRAPRPQSRITPYSSRTSTVSGMGRASPSCRPSR